MGSTARHASARLSYTFHFLDTPAAITLLSNTKWHRMFALSDFCLSRRKLCGVCRADEVFVGSSSVQAFARVLCSSFFISSSQVLRSWESKIFALMLKIVFS